MPVELHKAALPVALYTLSRFPIAHAGPYRPTVRAVAHLLTFAALPPPKRVEFLLAISGIFVSELFPSSATTVGAVGASIVALQALGVKTLLAWSTLPYQWLVVMTNNAISSASDASKQMLAPVREAAIQLSAAATPL